MITPIPRNQLRLVLEDEPRVDSRDLAAGLGIDHRNLIQTIRKYEDPISEFGVLRFQTAKPPRGSEGGRPETVTCLTEDQAYFVLTLSRNTNQVVSLKKRLVAEFGKLRRRSEKRAKLEWQQARVEGKDARRHETDTIQDFVRYAQEQGSKNAPRYYSNITKMTYKALFLVEAGLPKPNNFRDLLESFQLTFLATAEYVCAAALRDGMKRELPYKDIYLLAKERVETFAVSVGRTPLLPAA